MQDLIYLERNGGIYRGYRADFPIEYWDVAMQIWQPCRPDEPRPQGWARELSAEEALTFMNPDELARTAPPVKAEEPAGSL